MSETLRADAHVDDTVEVAVTERRFSRDYGWWSFPLDFDGGWGSRGVAANAKIGGDFHSAQSHGDLRLKPIGIKRERDQAGKSGYLQGL